MNRPILLTATLSALAATAALAQAPQPSTTPSSDATTSTADSTKMVCRSQGDSSSRLARRRVCVTQAEWEEQRRLSRMDVEKAQTNRSWCKNGPC
ncbi:MAG TPA: hypothetical protein VEW04_06710 [Allosphingosinicella sp.]|nr:hypothetical protein [Allosphingosinicella sp.]